MPPSSLSSCWIDSKVPYQSQSTSSLASFAASGGELCHNAVGATLYRAQNVGGNWSEWMPYASTTAWQAQLDVPVLVQYFSQLSAGFIVGDCLASTGRRCHVSWHDRMFLRGELNDWGGSDEGHMMLIKFVHLGIQHHTKQVYPCPLYSHE